mgnify:FL=1
MTELMQPNMKYKFYLTNREFIATFIEISPPRNTLIVSNYLDENGCVPGTRTMPFSWVKRVELERSDSDSDTELETIHLDKVSYTGHPVYRRKTRINNFMKQ